MSQLRLSAAEYRQLVETAGSPRRVRLPEGEQAAASLWPVLALGVPRDDPALSAPVVGQECWCLPIAQAVPGQSGSVAMVLSTQDSEIAAGVSVSGDRWSMVATWTPRQARLLAAQLLRAAADAERRQTT